MEAACDSLAIIRTELKAGRFISTCSLLISFSGLGKQSFSDSKNAFVPVIPNDIYAVLGLILLSGFVL